MMMKLAAFWHHFASVCLDLSCRWYQVTLQPFKKKKKIKQTNKQTNKRTNGYIFFFKKLQKNNLQVPYM